MERKKVEPVGVSSHSPESTQSQPQRDAAVFCTDERCRTEYI